MVNICADDYGLEPISSGHIQECIDLGILHRVSVFPNFDEIDLNAIRNGKNTQLALHINLVEGRSLADHKEIGLLADENGALKHDFVGLLGLSLLRRKEFKEQIRKEIKAQVAFWKSILPDDMPFCVDSHQHTHMIPAVFKCLLEVLREENISPEHMRIPAEPLLPYLKTPSLYFTYSPLNMVKHWLLAFLWQIDKRFANAEEIHKSYYLGIMFSGNMDENRIKKVLPEYIKLAEKKGKAVDVSFHPGYPGGDSADFGERNVAFKGFYLSDKRKTEYHSLINLSKEV